MFPDTENELAMTHTRRGFLGFSANTLRLKRERSLGQKQKTKK
jgi:hypothetical protein